MPLTHQKKQKKNPKLFLYSLYIHLLQPPLHPPAMNSSKFNLALGLGLSISNTDSISFNTCLSLGPTMNSSSPSPHQLTIDVNKSALDDSHEFTSSQSQSAASYLSSSTGKRDREDEKIYRVSDEDEDGGSCRKKLRLTKEQSSLLEHSFKSHSTLNPKQKQVLARELNLRPRQVEVWFQNRRARTKLKQTEMDCELLKKCCEALRGENRILIKELQELKAVKLAQPLYMKLPATTLTMCPSCERVGGGGSAAAQKTPFSMPKPHLGIFRYFANSSAAC